MIRHAHHIVPVALLAACPPAPVAETCAEADACATTGSSTTGDETTPTTSDGGEAVTDSSSDTGVGSTGPDSETTAETTTTTDQPAEPPSIVDGVVMPDFVDMNALLDVLVTAQVADGVRMAIDGRAPIELMGISRDEFVGQIAVFTGLDNGKHTAVFTPWRAALIGASVAADYEVALPPPGDELVWDSEIGDGEGHLAALGVLPDGSPVEFRTRQVEGASRCYLYLRTRDGKVIATTPVLANAHCKAIDMTVDPESGVMHVLLERLSGDGPRWWAGRIGGWKAAVMNIGIGEIGDEALAITARSGLAVVCGAKPVATPDERDAMAVLLRQGKPAEQRLFDYQLEGDPEEHKFVETFRDCTFAGDKLVLVGETKGKHDQQMPKDRERLTLIEYDPAADHAAWTVAGPGPGVQSRGLAVTVDDTGRYHVAGYTCLDECVPEGTVRVHAPGGKLETQVAFPLGSAWFGPHDIAWHPAGYAVVALGEQQGNSFVFKVQAFAPGVPAPLWTFVPQDKQGPQFALAVAVGPLGDVYAGGIDGGGFPVFAVIGG